MENFSQSTGRCTCNLSQGSTLFFPSKVILQTFSTFSYKAIASYTSREASHDYFPHNNNNNNNTNNSYLI